MKSITIFGSTGSIGCNTLDLIARAPQQYRVVALTGAHNIALLAKQARQFNAELAVTSNPALLPDLRDALSGSGIEAAAGAQALCEAATRPADWVMSAIVGAAGLAPSLKALEQGMTLALANKESMVCAGPLMQATAARFGATILPVDSEHSAVFQALLGEDIDTVERVIITASGGAFRDWTLAQMAKATLADATTHPNWDMGQRITIDSASMFNKALEIIEAKEFFDFAPEQIEVLVHPESLVHAMVGFRDGALMAHIGTTDMRHAIGFALHYPHRAPLPVARLDFTKIARLNFSAPDPKKYPAIGLAYRVMAQGGLSGAVFNAAKEAALDAFIAGKIGFLKMSELVERALDNTMVTTQSNVAIDLEHILAADQVTRAEMDDLVQRYGQ